MSIDKPAVVLKRFFWKFFKRILFTINKKTFEIISGCFIEQIQNIEKSKASAVEVVLGLRL